MALVRWDPFADLFRAQDQMSRLFDDMPRRRARKPTGDTRWAPPVDIFEDQETFVIKAELPEIDAANVDIRLENDTLTLTGERKLERDESKDQYHAIERFYGKFSRSFSLPDSVDRDKVTAEAKDGVLRLVLPKKPETKPRAIDIKVA